MRSKIMPLLATALGLWSALVPALNANAAGQALQPKGNAKPLAEVPGGDLPKWLEGKNIRWREGSELTVEGRGRTDDLPHPYARWPKKAEPLFRRDKHAGMYMMGRNFTSGIALRFHSDAQMVYVHWKLTDARTLNLSNMTPLGTSGVDLYQRTAEGRWHFAGVGRPDKLENRSFIANPAPARDSARMIEYLLYLPLYNGVEFVRVGVDEGMKLEPVPPRTTRPVVIYGTSIVQGASASRPGYCYPAILGRVVDREVVNLGFSASAWNDPAVAELLAELDPELFILDPVGNLNRVQMDDVVPRWSYMVRTIRKARPQTPIVIMELPRFWLPFPKDPWNVATRKAYDQLVAEGVPNLHYVPGNHLIGHDTEGTTDGVHPNDLGMNRIADILVQIVGKLRSGQTNSRVWDDVTPGQPECQTPNR
jgi:hypothetical protein